MKKIGCIRCIPIEKIGSGKLEFCKFLGGRIVVYKINDEEEDSVVEEYENVEDLLTRGRKLGFHGVDLFYISRLLS
ncbi:MAG: hypothetical protein KA007_03550 [Candidatus Pacebacteria bacterium]|nr:hypothetical protein [Candidatus Paceibacterota bacterium]